MRYTNVYYYVHSDDHAQPTYEMNTLLANLKVTYARRDVILVLGLYR